MNLLGIDFGLKRIGLAWGDSETGLVEPLGVINRSPKLLPRLVKICQTHKIEKIVVGLPDGKLKPIIKDFALELKEMTNLPVALQDESLTSQKALAMMIETGKSKKARQTEKDAFAAAVILQEYLNV